MSDLSVTLLGHKLKNPIIAASGTFGFGYEFERYFDPSLLGGISLKALTLDKKIGNPPPRIAETKSGMLNSVGLQNPGVDYAISHILPLIRKYDTVLIANVAGSTEEEYVEVVEKLNETDIDLFELNISCPNVHQGGMAFGADPHSAQHITQAIKAVAKKPLLVKLSPNVTSIVDVAKAVAQGGADGISLVNTFLSLAVDLKRRKPILANNTGGLSGGAIKPIALRMVRDVCKSVDIPVVGMGGIMSGTDALEFMLCGAVCCMVGTANVSDPYACPKIICEMNEYLDANNIQSVNQLIGTLEEY